MPIHDWTRVQPGTYHNFHFLWLARLLDCLNAGVLPEGWFAMAERRTGESVTDVLADPDEAAYYARKTNRIAIHHGLGTIVAVLELVSPGNKDTKAALRSFARKSAALLRNGVHLSVIDPFPPGRHDPHGIHRAIWEFVTLEPSVFEPPPDKPLTLVAYQAGEVPTAYVEPFAIGQALPNLAIFLDEEAHVTVPLEETYQATWDVLPIEIRDLIAPTP